MSRAGRIHLTTGTESTYSCTDFIGEVASELGPAARDILSFFGKSVVEFLTASPYETQSEVMKHIRQEGARSVSIEGGELGKNAEALRGRIRDIAASMGVHVPDALETAVPVVTKNTLAILEEAVQSIENNQKEKLQQLASQMEEERQRALSAYEDACLVIGYHADSGSEPSFANLEQMLDSIVTGDADSRERIAELAAEIEKKLEEATETAWTGATLAVSEEVLKRAGFTATQLDIENGTVTGRIENSRNKGVNVTVNPASGELNYDVVGYEGDECVDAERTFLTSLEDVLGTTLTAQNLVHWSTEEPSRSRSDVEQAAEETRGWLRESDAGSTLPGQEEQRQ